MRIAEREHCRKVVFACGCAKLAALEGDIMKIRFATGCLAVVALAWSFGLTGCCCQRKGFVMRGDWSLELNRVPHMRSNGPTYSGDSCAVPCDTYSCTSETCTDINCTNCRYGDGAGMSGGGRSGGPRGAGGYYEGGPGGPGGYDSGPHVPAPPQPTPAAQSRFHPVPTRPVFEPQHSMAEVPADAGLSASENRGSSRRAVERRVPATPSGSAAAPRSHRVAERSDSFEESEFVQAAAAEPLEFDGDSSQPSESEIAASQAVEPQPAVPAGDWRVKVRRS